MVHHSLPLNTGGEAARFVRAPVLWRLLVIDPSLGGLFRRVHRIERHNRAFANFPSQPSA